MVDAIPSLYPPHSEFMEAKTVSANVAWTSKNGVGSAAVTVPYEGESRKQALHFLCFLRGLARCASDRAALGDIFDCSRGSSHFLEMNIDLPISVLYARLPQLTKNGVQDFGCGYSVDVSLTVDFMCLRDLFEVLLRSCYSQISQSALPPSPPTDGHKTGGIEVLTILAVAAAAAFALAITHRKK
jgi:hypothetical protein